MAVTGSMIDGDRDEGHEHSDDDDVDDASEKITKHEQSAMILFFGGPTSVLNELFRHKYRDIIHQTPIK